MFQIVASWATVKWAWLWEHHIENAPELCLVYAADPYKQVVKWLRLFCQDKSHIGNKTKNNRKLLTSTTWVTQISHWYVKKRGVKNLMCLCFLCTLCYTNCTLYARISPQWLAWPVQLCIKSECCLVLRSECVDFNQHQKWVLPCSEEWVCWLTGIKSECCLVLRSECVDWPASKVSAALSWGVSVLTDQHQKWMLPCPEERVCWLWPVELVVCHSRRTGFGLTGLGWDRLLAINRVVLAN